MSKSGNTSKRAGTHPYLRMELWANGTLAFWRGKQGYNHEEYERRLMEQVKNERNSSIFTENIQRNQKQ